MKKKKVTKIKRKKPGRPKEIKRLDLIKYKRMKRSHQWVILECSKCHKKTKIDINIGHKELYTEKVRKNWVCMFCRYDEKKGKRI